MLARGRILLLFGVAALLVSARGAAQFAEYAIKGEFIERFTHFIDWPESAFRTPDASFVLCIAGENPFGDYLARLVRERTLKGRRVLLLHLSAPPDVDVCALVFVARDQKDNLAAILARTRAKPILTIADTPGFAQAGALINFFREGDFVRFEINADEAKRSGLKFSSRLMKLARIVNAAQGKK